MPLLNKPVFKLFLTFWIIYIVFARIDGWPENSRLDLTRAIVDEGRFEIDTYANNTGDRAYYNGHYYTDKFPGGSFIAVPPYFVFKYLFGTPSINNNFYSLNPTPAYNFMVFFVIMFTSALFSALTVVLVYKMASFFTDKKSHKYIAAIAYGLGTIAFNYATLFYDHAISTFFSFACFYLIFKMKREKTNKYYFFAGLLGGFAIITSPLTFIIIFGCFIFVLLTKKLKNILNFSIGCFLILLILFSYNFIAFDNPIDSSYNHIDVSIFGWDYEELSISSCHFKTVDDNIFSRIRRDFLRLKSYFFKLYTCETTIVQYYSPLFNNTFLRVESEIGEESVLLDYKFSNPLKQNDYLIKKYIYTHSLNEYIIYVKLFYEGKKLFNNQSSDWYSVYTSNNLISSDSNLWNKALDYYVTDNGVFRFYHKTGFYSYTDCPFWLNEPFIDNILKSSDNFVCEDTLFYTLGGSVQKRFFIKANITILDNETLMVGSNSYQTRKFINNFIVKISYPVTNSFNVSLRLLFYPYRGLLFYNIILVFSFVGLFFMFKKYKLLSLMIIFFFFFFLLYTSATRFWWGGTSFGPRHLLPVIAFLMIPLIFSFKKVPMKLILFVLMISIIVNILGLQELEQKYVVVDEDVRFEPELWNKLHSWHPIRNPLFDHYLPLFFRYGPRSMLLERIFRASFKPFINLLCLFVLTIIIWFKSLKKVLY